MKNALNLDKKTFNKLFKSKNSIFIDIRNSDSFNGWKLNGEKLSGHIKSAINFPFSYFKNEEKIFNNFSFSTLNKNQNIIICYTKENEFLEIFNYLKSKNFINIYKLNMVNIKKNHQYYLEYYKNYKLLVPPKFAYLQSKKSLFKIFHVGFGEELKTSEKGHLNGSVYINTDQLEPPPNWTIGSTEVLLKFIEKYNLSITDKLIITAWNQMASFRVALIFMYMGFKDVRVLNGGLEFYEKNNFPLFHNKNKLSNSIINHENLNLNHKLIISTERLKKLLPQKNFTLVDNRTWIEHIGESSGYSYSNKKARIPGSIYGYAGYNGPQSLDYYRNSDNTMKSKKEVMLLFKNSKINLHNQLTFMCGSGWRAAEVFFYMKVLGFKNISVYSDGFINWSKDPKNPVERGIPNN